VCAGVRQAETFCLKFTSAESARDFGPESGRVALDSNTREMTRPDCGKESKPPKRVKPSKSRWEPVGAFRYLSR